MIDVPFVPNYKDAMQFKNSLIIDQLIDALVYPILILKSVINMPTVWQGHSLILFNLYPLHHPTIFCCLFNVGSWGPTCVQGLHPYLLPLGHAQIIPPVRLEGILVACTHPIQDPPHALKWRRSSSTVHPGTRWQDPLFKQTL